MKHFFFVNSYSNAMFIPFSEIGLFDKVQKRVAKAVLIVVSNIDSCLFFS